MSFLWRKPAPVENEIPREIPIVNITKEEAEAAELVTLELIEKQGYALWKCQVLRGEIIEVVSESEKAKALGYPVYTLKELDLLNQLKDSTVRLIYQAKKHGAVVISVKDRKP